MNIFLDVKSNDLCLAAFGKSYHGARLISPRGVTPGATTKHKHIWQLQLKTRREVNSQAAVNVVRQLNFIREGEKTRSEFGFARGIYLDNYGRDVHGK